MKQWIIFVLVCSLLLAFVGCGKNSEPQTPTNLSSVASQIQKETESQGVSIPQKQEASTVSQPKKNPVKPSAKPNDTKTKLSWKQPEKTPKIRSQALQPEFLIAVCNTYEEYETFLRVPVKDSPYTKEYFKKGSLIMVNLSTPDTATEYVPRDLYLENQTLVMEWDEKSMGYGGAVSTPWQYFIEVKESIKGVEKALFKMRRFNGEKYKTEESTVMINQISSVLPEQPREKEKQRVKVIDANPRYPVAVCNSYQELKAYLPDGAVPFTQQDWDSGNYSLLVFFVSASDTFQTVAPEEIGVQGDTLYVKWRKYYKNAIEGTLINDYYYFWFTDRLPNLSKVHIEEYSYLSVGGGRVLKDTRENTYHIFPKN